MDYRGSRLAGVQQQGAQRGTEGRSELDVHRELFKEGSRTVGRLVNHLVGYHQMAGRDFLAQASDRGAGEDVSHSNGLQSEDVGPVGNSQGLSKCPSPWRESSATGTPWTSERTIG